MLDDLLSIALRVGMPFSTVVYQQLSCSYCSSLHRHQ